MFRRFKLPLWTFPLAIAALVGIFGWWGIVRLRETIEKELKAQLNATLNANVTALEIWTTNQLKLATSLATEPTVRDLGAVILERGVGQNSQSTFQNSDRLTTYLRPRLEIMGYQIA